MTTSFNPTLEGNKIDQVKRTNSQACDVTWSKLTGRTALPWCGGPRPCAPLTPPRIACAARPKDCVSRQENQSQEWQMRDESISTPAEHLAPRAAMLLGTITIRGANSGADSGFVLLSGRSGLLQQSGSRHQRSLQGDPPWALFEFFWVLQGSFKGRSWGFQGANPNNSPPHTRDGARVSISLGIFYQFVTASPGDQAPFLLSYQSLREKAHLVPPISLLSVGT